MVQAIRIKDWSIEPVREQISGTIGDPVIQITYKFLHIPQNFSAFRTFTYTKTQTDDRMLELLASETEELTKLLPKEQTDGYRN